MIELRDIDFRYPAVPEASGCTFPGSRFRPANAWPWSGRAVRARPPCLVCWPASSHRPGAPLTINDTDLGVLDDGQRRRFRIEHIGQVFQAFELLHYLTVVENVMLPHYIHASGQAEKMCASARWSCCPTWVWVSKADSRPGELSQGEQQRVAVCRAMLNQPALLLADEPTGNLDQANKQNVVDLLLDQAQRNRSTLLMVTHDQSLLASFSTVLDVQSVLAVTTGQGVEAA